MKKVASLFLAACLAFALTSCAAGGQSTVISAPTSGEKSITGSATATAGSLKIGIMAPLTGEVAIYGKAMANAVELAIAEINANGGISGKPIEYKIIDEKGDPTEAVNAYEKLKDWGMHVLLGDVTSKPTMAVAARAAEDKIPMITPTGTMAAITQQGSNVFRACFIDPFQGKIIAKFIGDNLKLKKIALIYNRGDDYSSGIAASTKMDAAANGLSVVAEENYGSDDKDFKTQLGKAISAGAEVIVFPDYYGKTALMAAQARSLGFKGPIVGPDGFDGVLSTVAKENIAVLDNVYYTNHYFDGDVDAKIASFIKNYKVKFNETPNSLAALGYDTVYIFKAAADTLGGKYTDKETFVNAIYKAKVAGVTGDIAYGVNGDPVKSVSVIKIEGGKQSLAAKVAP